MFIIVPFCGMRLISVMLVMSGNSCPVFIACAVSYTHLDVYKRQGLHWPDGPPDFHKSPRTL